MSTRIDDPRVQIAVETPNEPQAPGHDELQGIGSGEDRPPMPELAERPWMLQGEHTRGSRLRTVGLTGYAGHPELELLNLPTMFLEAGIRLLKELAGYVLVGGALDEGDVMQMRDALPCLVGFTHVKTDADETFVRVVLLS